MVSAATAAPANDKECIKVVVRCRPMNQKEKTEERFNIVDIDEKAGSIGLRNPDQPNDVKNFTFDHTFGMDAAQTDVYNKSARPIVEAVLNGYNGTIFAYGQTGSGKTFSMQGVRDVPELRGILPHAFHHIFDHIAHANSGTKYLVRASYLELYNEELRDLLVEKPTRLELKERPDVGVYVKDLTSYVVQNAGEMDKLMDAGNKHRVVAATLMNATSSRSHSIFSITVEMAEPGTDGEDHIRVGKLHLVDLAGSERQEAAKINLSLTALGNVISALVDGKSAHIPYRDSKLTRLLQDSLGGNAKTVMMATVSPASYNFDESLSTLRYANRTKQIKNKPKINEDPKDAMLREYQEEIQRLKAQLEAAEGGAPVSGVNGAGEGDNDNEEEEEATSGDEEQQNASAGAPKSPGSKHAPATSVRLLSDEKIKEMKQRIQKEKETLLQSKTMAEVEKQKLLSDIETRAKELEKEQQERETLAKKLTQMEAKLLVGGVNVLDAAEAHERELRQKEAELEEQQRQERQLRQELERQEELQFHIEESYSSLQEEAASKTKKLKKLWTMLMKQKSEIADLQSEQQRQREEMLDTIRNLTADLKLKSLMVNRFIPESYMELIEANATFDPALDRWRIPHIAHAGNNIKGKRMMISGDSATMHRQRRDDVDGGWDETDGGKGEENLSSLYNNPVILFPDLFLTYDLYLPGAPAYDKNRSKRAASSMGNQRGRPASSRKAPIVKKDVAPQARGLVNRPQRYA